LTPKAFVLAFVVGLAFAVGLVNGSCSVGNYATAVSAQDPDCYVPECMNAIKKHVQLEFNAALQYLVMGAFFGQDNVNLEGFSKMFYDHSNEERAHGLQLIEYLRMRGDNDNDFYAELSPVFNKYSWSDGEEALKDALAMEKKVTGEIKLLVDKCAADYHAADWLTGSFLDEQLNGQRHLATMINTFATFRKTHEALADWMFSQHLVKSA